jgi:hypothetical protein
MSFTVSIGFNSYETIKVTTRLELFQKPTRKKLKPAINRPPIASCFTVSVVSLLIHSVNETQKVFGRWLRACVYIVVIVQDYTKQAAARRGQHGI